MIDALAVCTFLGALALGFCAYVARELGRAWFRERAAERDERTKMHKAADVAALDALVAALQSRVVLLETDFQKRRQDALVGKGRS